MDATAPQTLQAWIESVLARSITKLNHAYWRNEQAETETEPLYHKTRLVPLEKQHSTPPPPALAVPDTLLQQLYHKLFRRRCESAVWNAVIWHLSQPLPSAIAHDLLDRLGQRIETTMEHSRQQDDVQWRLAALHGEALQTLVLERYTQECFSTEDLNELFIRHPDSFWWLSFFVAKQASSLEKEQLFWRMANQRAHPDTPWQVIEKGIIPQMYTDAEYPPAPFQAVLDSLRDNYLLLVGLARLHTDSQEKADFYLSAVRSHPRSAEIMKVYVRTQQMKQAEEATLDKVLFEQLYSTADSEIWYKLAANPSLDDTACRRLYSATDSNIALCLAANPATPTDLLQTLRQIQAVRYARQIRSTALAQLRERHAYPIPYNPRNSPSSPSR
ncbi:MAG: hypothetical protein M3Z04_15640 [Chloroflexota bacterium]|nr:hypothetical protein [Chloroflexota bacterium]